MSATHTPGPWFASGDSIVTGGDENCIANIETDGGYEVPIDERSANAALIAAAPELLEACQRIAKDFTEGGFDAVTIGAIEDAIAAAAKAEGITK